MKAKIYYYSATKTDLVEGRFVNGVRYLASRDWDQAVQRQLSTRHKIFQKVESHERITWEFARHGGSGDSAASQA
jgi:hypothetical protein